MRKAISVLLIVFFLLLALSLTGFKVNAEGSQVIHVPSEDFPTIQEAIDNATSGDTILVARGIYNEQISITKSLFLVGENREATVIDGYDAEYVILIAAENVTVQGFTITKSTLRPYDYGIRVDQAGGVVIKDTIITNTFTGLTLFSSTNTVVSGNIIVNNTNGITLLSSTNNVFSNNLVSNNTAGIGVFVSSSSENVFYHNNFFDTVMVRSASPNIWSRNGEGNFWASYSFNGKDLDEDGIGDEPYSVNDDNDDNYPLMGPFSEFSVAFKGETYGVTVISNSTVSDFSFGIGTETGNGLLDFKSAGANGTIGFCRIMIPTALIDYPFTVLDREGELVASLLGVSNETNAYLYFTYNLDDQRITVISSKALQLYNELVEEYNKLQLTLDNLNASFQTLLTDYSMRLETEIRILNATYQDLSESLNALLEIENNYPAMSSSLSENVQNIRNLTYVLAATTAGLLATAAYLSSRVYAAKKPKGHAIEEAE